jgi:transcriptional regulator with XRE-family HTH domain
MSEMRDDNLGSRLRHLRTRCQLSARQLAERAGVAPSYVSGVESGRVSPTIATLRKMLLALGTDLGAFFSDDGPATEGQVFPRETMRTVVDGSRCYAFVLPRRADVGLEILDEELRPGETPEFETLTADLAGYVLRGELTLELDGRPARILRTGDAFYVPAGMPVRGWCAGEESVRLVTVTAAPTY